MIGEMGGDEGTLAFVCVLFTVIPALAALSRDVGGLGRLAVE
jgi:hypothetical protein